MLRCKGGALLKCILLLKELKITNFRPTQKIKNKKLTKNDNTKLSYLGGH